METIEDLDKALADLIAEANNEKLGEDDDRGNSTDTNNGDASDNDAEGTGTDDDIDSLIASANSENSEESDESDSKDKKEFETNDSNTDGNEDKQEQRIDPISVQINGQNISLNTLDEVKAFIANKSVPEFKQDILKDNKLTSDDVQLLLDIKAGNISAIHKAIKDSNIDLLDIESFKGEYSPTAKLNIKSDIDYAVESIQADVELDAKMRAIVPSLPKEFVNAIGASADDIRAFSQHVKSGVFDKVYPEAVKAQLLSGGNLLDHYNLVGSKMFATANQEQSKSVVPDQKPVSKPQPQQRQVSEKEKELRKRASGSDQSQHKKGSSDVTVDDIWDMTPEQLAELDLRDLD